MTNYHTGLFRLPSSQDVWEWLKTIKTDQYDLDEEDEVSSEKDHHPYTDASNFLQGSCDLFARALNEVYGYPTFQIRKGLYLHCFCIAKWKDMPVYIDVRGATSNFREFCEDTGLKSCGCMEKDIEPMEKDDVPGQFDDVGIAFSKAIIDNYDYFYTLSTLGDISSKYSEPQE